MVQMTYVCASAMITEAILSFIGAGTPPIIPSWGNIMAENRALWQIKPVPRLHPGGLFCALTVLGVQPAGRRPARRCSIRGWRNGSEPLMLLLEDPGPADVRFATADRGTLAGRARWLVLLHRWRPEKRWRSSARAARASRSRPCPSFDCVQRAAAETASSGAILLQGPRPAAGRTDGDALYHVRGGEISMIFQEPMTSLNPVHDGGAIRSAKRLRLHQPHQIGE